MAAKTDSTRKLKNDNAPVYEVKGTLSPTVTLVVPELAAEIGLYRSLVLMQVVFLVSLSRNVHDGERWAWLAIRDLRTNYFCYMSVGVISKCLTQLEKMALIKSRNDIHVPHHPNVKWYAVDPRGWQRLGSVSLADVRKSPADRRRVVHHVNNVVHDVNDSVHHVNDSHGETLPQKSPEITTETTTEKKSSTAVAVRPEKSSRKADPYQLDRGIPTNLVGGLQVEQDTSATETNQRLQQRGAPDGAHTATKKAPPPKAGKREKPYAHVAHETRTAIIQAWVEHLPAPPVGNMYGRDSNHQTAADLVDAGYTAEQVARFVQVTVAEPFWRGKTLTLQKVAELIPAWRAKQAPKRDRSWIPAEPVVEPRYMADDPPNDPMLADLRRFYAEAEALETVGAIQ